MGAGFIVIEIMLIIFGIAAAIEIIADIIGD